MNVEQHHATWVIILSFFISFILAIIPLPDWAISWRPDWVALVLIYWCIALPQRVGIATGWFLGIILDVLHDTLFGQHALALSLVAYISVKLHKQMRLFPRWQQATVVFALVVSAQLIGVWIHSLFGSPEMNQPLFYPALTSLLLWPWLFIILRDMRRTYKVS